MNIFKKITLLTVFLFLVSCASNAVYEQESREILDYLLSDLPIPADAEVRKESTVILGTGNGIAGRVILNSPRSPAKNLIFYGGATTASGWTLASSTVGIEIILVYTKENRYATIEIQNSSGIIAGFGGNGPTSQIIISVVHPNAVQSQNPYAEGTYSQAE